jgi:SAM-dependent methyltransferase
VGVWGDRLLPRVIDLAGGSAVVRRRREQVCAGLHGTVLEVGFGSGLNLPHYPASVTEVLAVEPSDAAWRLSASRRAASPVPVRRSDLDGQRLSEGDGTVDGVLSTLTLCTIPDVAAALAELRRVLRPGGRLHFFEHGRAPEPRVRSWQHRLDPLQGAVFGGCHLGRDIPALVRAAGFTLDDLEEAYLPGPRLSRPWTYGYLGLATR